MECSEKCPKLVPIVDYSCSSVFLTCRAGAGSKSYLALVHAVPDKAIKIYVSNQGDYIVFRRWSSSDVTASSPEGAHHN